MNNQADHTALKRMAHYHENEEFFVGATIITETGLLQENSLF